MFLGKASEIVGYIFSSTKTVELRRPTSSSGASRFAGSFSVDIWYTFDVIDAYNIANFFQICSTLAAFEELDGRFEPTRNGEIC